MADGGFEQCYNAQAVVAACSRLMVTADAVQAPNDKRRLSPMLDKFVTLSEDLSKPDTMLLNNGYFSAANVMACGASGITPLIAPGAAVPSSILKRPASPRRRPRRTIRHRPKRWSTI